MHLDPYRFRSSVVILHHVLISFPFWANCMRGNEKKMCIIETPCPIARRRPGGTGGKKEMVDKDYMVGIDFTAITSPEGCVAPTKKTPNQEIMDPSDGDTSTFTHSY